MSISSCARHRTCCSHGWPAFDCGGQLQRGLLLQYLTAPLSLLGVSWESAPRIVSAHLQPAGPARGVRRRPPRRRPALGLLALTVIALSVWETEMARFGRMYAPFQAVFLWYLVFFLRRTVDRDSRAAVPMVILTIIGALLWEGGVLLALANLLPVLLNGARCKPVEGRMARHARCTLPCSPRCMRSSRRTFACSEEQPALPLDYDSAATPIPRRAGTLALWAALLGSRVWLALSLIPVARECCGTAHPMAAARRPPASAGARRQRCWQRWRINSWPRPPCCC